MNNDNNYKIEDLILRYRNGEENASEEILVLFTPLLRKYSNLIRYKKWNRQDKDLRDFLSFFLGKKNIDYSIELLHSTFKNYYELEDLEQELVAALLETCSKCYIITVSYKYILANRLKYLVFKDPITRSDMKVEFSSNTAQENFINEVKAPEDKEELEEDWITGNCSETFQNLSELERKILYYIFKSKETKNPDIASLQLIANKVGVSLRTVHNIKNVALKKIKRNLQNNRLVYNN